MVTSITWPPPKRRWPMPSPTRSRPTSAGRCITMSRATAETMRAGKYAIGLDYGTNSVRTLVVDVGDGREVATALWNYEHGAEGVILSRDPNLARQHPADYLEGAEVTMKKALAAASRSVRAF